MHVISYLSLTEADHLENPALAEARHGLWFPMMLNPLGKMNAGFLLVCLPA